jgi:hypothetical protein
MWWIFALLACSDPDPDAVGPRWETGSDPRPTTTDPATLTVVEPTTTPTGDTGGDPGLCAGDGDAFVEVGSGGLQGFRAYVDGDDLPLSIGESGLWGFVMDVHTDGLDTSGDVNAVLRVGFEGDDGREPLQEEWLARLRLQCPRPGPGWVQVFAPLPDPLEGLAGGGGLDGLSISLAMSVVDRSRDEDTAQVDLRLTR